MSGYENLNIKFHFGDRVKKDGEEVVYIVVSYDDKDGIYTIYRDGEWKGYGTEKYRFGHSERVSERAITRHYEGELASELSILEESQDIVRMHRELISKIKANDKWYNKIFNTN